MISPGNAGADARVAQRAEPVQHLLGHPGDARDIVGLGQAGRVDTARRSSICTNRPESGRLDQSAFAVTWNRTTLPCPSGARVTSGVPSVSEAIVRSDRSGSGCAMTWLSTVTSSGIASP
jgi:hypothetical protein